MIDFNFLIIFGSILGRSFFLLFFLFLVTFTEINNLSNKIKPYKNGTKSSSIPFSFLSYSPFCVSHISPFPWTALMVSNKMLKISWMGWLDTWPKSEEHKALVTLACIPLSARLKKKKKKQPERIWDRAQFPLYNPFSK